jgi:ribonuclease J
LKLNNVRHLSDRQPIVLGPFTITPFLVDHSAYDSYSVLVEADGKRLFYTGDFRGHGRKASLVDRLVSDPPPDVDVLLMEGTCVGREDTAFPTEDDLIHPMTDLFHRTTGMPLVWCSGQNIDRIVTVFKACQRARRQFIIDLYTAEILRATGNERLPQANWNGIKVFLPHSQKRRIIQEKAFEVTNHYKPFRIYHDELAAAAPRSVMLFRPSMTRDLDQAQCLTGAAVLCSLWSGYVNEPRQQPFVTWLNDRGIPLAHCHTSGHASIADLGRMRKAFPTAVAVPVHLQDQQQFASLFCNVQLRGDGEWWGIG